METQWVERVGKESVRNRLSGRSGTNHIRVFLGVRRADRAAATKVEQNPTGTAGESADSVVNVN